MSFSESSTIWQRMGTSFSLGDVSRRAQEAMPAQRLFDTDAFRETVALVGNEARTVPLLATLVWNSIGRMGSFRELLYRHGLAPDTNGRREYQVMPVGEGVSDSYVLAVMDANVRQPSSVELSFTLGETVAPPLSNGSGVAGAVAERLRGGLMRNLLATGRWTVVFLPLPDGQLTSMVPNPAAGVAIGAGLASAGIVCSRGGRPGVTTALHAFSLGGVPAVAGAPATFDPSGVALPLILAAQDAAQDAAFLEFAAPGSAVPGVIPSGVLSGLTPRGNEPVSFYGTVNTGPTHVRTWSWDLLQGVPGNQVKVFTDRVTDPGDSGAALLDGADQVLGFAFYRTAPGQVPSHSAWVWADSLVRGLGLDPF